MKKDLGHILRAPELSLCNVEAGLIESLQDIGFDKLPHKNSLTGLTFNVATRNLLC